jgi:hypothetical protein
LVACLKKRIFPNPGTHVQVLTGEMGNSTDAKASGYLKEVVCAVIYFDLLPLPYFP